ncbi:MAG TPA: hypothetical protein DIT67_14435 [Octadecabacter sp.]|nr:hypothetical protein [Octadecabacter sp.]
MKNFILQAVTPENHIEAVSNLLTDDTPTRVIISTAFMSESGLSSIEEAMQKVADKTEMYVGIRNGITTAQALEKALAIGCKLYAVDTGSRTRIFHPKMYFSVGKDAGQIIIGSANLTLGGLNSNIEASLFEALDLADSKDAGLVEQITERFDAMLSDYPKHVFEVTSQAQIDDLLVAGRVIDEGDITRPSAVGASKDRDRDDIPTMAFRTKLLRRAVARKAKAAKPPAPKTDSGKPIKVSSGGLEFVWESSPLTRRDLDIPIAKGTHATGSMLWKKGNSEIDQQTYFRSDVFDKLDWRADPKLAGKELAEATFQIVIRGVDYGLHELTVTNDTRTDTASYKQRQPMSAVRWGEARPLIARDDLLERSMRLYRDPDDEGVFVIDID